MMKKFLFFLFFTLPITLFANPITNVRAIQEEKKIVILYDLNEDTYVSHITMVFDGKSRVIPNKCLKGDIDKDLTSGVNKRVEYDVLADYTDGFKSNNVVFVIEQGGIIYAVDLGLSVKWASCNVGATRPEEYGDYFAWGEIKPQKQYDWSTYKYCNNTYNSMTKYCTCRSYGIVDNKIILELEDDVAHMALGDVWRMPTNKELSELQQKCKWTWTTQNGVKGYKVTGKNGNSIFMPAAGYMRTGRLYDVGLDGLYWSSSLFEGFSNGAYRIYFNRNNVDLSNGYRSYGRSVRAVCP